MRVHRGGRRVGYPGRGNETDRRAGLFRDLAQALERSFEHAGATLTLHAGVDVDHAGASFGTGHHGGRGARRIGHLLIGVVGFDQRQVRKALEFEQVLLARHAARLTVENPCCGHRRDAHAVADEQDDVLGALRRIAGLRAPRQCQNQRGQQHAAAAA